MLAFIPLAPINPIEIIMTVALTGGQLAAPVPLFDLKSYDRIVFALSGGKDSVAAALALKEAGARPDQIMFIHHEVDGREGSTLMDWAASPGYCRAFADHFGAPLISSWREGGFEGEMLRDNATTGAVNYELAGEVTRLPPSDHAPLGTRLAFPQVAADLSVRWCSAVLKIDVADRVLRNHPMFQNSRTLFVTGERAEESPQRARYAAFEAHRADRRAGKAKRHIDHLRPVLYWSEEEVWAIMQRHGIRPHPAYDAGFGRLSCRNCIFAGESQLATLSLFDPQGFEQIAGYEEQFGRTIHRSKDVRSRARSALPFAAATEERMAAAMAPFEGPIWIDPILWMMPAGAFQKHGGPV